MRVHELAKELKLSSKEMLERLKALGISVKSHASSLDDAAVARVRKTIGSTSSKTAEPSKSVAEPPKKASAAKPAVESPAPAKTAHRVASAPPTPTRAPVQATEPGHPAKTATVKKSLEPKPEKPATKAAPQPVMAKKPESPVAVAPPVAARAATAVESKPPKAEPARAGVALKKLEQPVAVVEESPEAAKPTKKIELRYPVSVKDLAAKIDISPSDLIKYLMRQGVFASMGMQLNEATAVKAALEFNCEVLPQPTLEEQLLKAAEPDPAKLLPRAPVVTLMGHVDHGKTSLLDAIRQAKVAESEAGGITQHIGAYEVQLEKGKVTFLDTPGHEAFTALRARGANVTDVVVLVVAADDGVMPQTVEAIDHARAADVPIVVAMNKIDKPGANPEKLKQQLAKYNLLSEDWGGKTIMVPVSAKTREGIDNLLEMLLLESELLELRADPTVSARGSVIEAEHTKNRGAVATLLVQQGTLRLGDLLVIGHLAGRVRAMIDDRGHRIKEAGPSKAVAILGLPEVPEAGDQFIVVTDEKSARQLVELRQDRRAVQSQIHPKRITLDDLHQRITEGKLKDLRLILKSDVQGSLEAIEQSLQKLDQEKTEVQIKLLHTGTGDINESDVILAAASDAIIVGFHVGIEPRVQVLAAKEGVDVHIYHIIYDLINALKAAIEGLLEPTIEETFVGRAEVRKLFQISKFGMVAGCMVTKGSMRRDTSARVIRGRDRLYEGKMSNLKRVKDDVREVQEGTECGISLEGNVDLQVGDLIESWEIKKVAKKLA